MKNISIFTIALAFIFSFSAAPLQAANGNLNTINDAPEVEVDGISAERWKNITQILCDTHNGDEVVRILTKNLPVIES